MKKVFLFLLITMLAMGLLACDPGQSSAAQTLPTEAPTEATQPPTEAPTEPSVPEEGFAFPAGSTLFGVDLAGMTPQDACAAINDALAAYKLHLSVNNTDLLLTQEHLQLQCAEEEILTYASLLEQGTADPILPTLRFDSNTTRTKLVSALNVSPRDAGIRYNSNTDRFEITKAVSGRNVDLNSIIEGIDPAIQALQPELSLSVSTMTVKPNRTADDAALHSALAKANAYLDISLTYTYTPATGGSLGSQTITRDEIASFVAFDRDWNPSISADEVNAYADKMSGQYSTGGGSGQFKTTGGSYINLQVSYAGQPVDTGALAGDITACLNGGISGTRPAPYIDPSICQDLAYDGNYIEINLSAQYLWVYRGGECVVSTPIVSGSVVDMNYTPTGVYSIYKKARSTYLVGADYRSYVDYWMPFSGGYGLHDANWRSSFGGDIYLYNGSHGCVNIPPSQAGTVYNNISVGTKVILYGGATQVTPVQQEITGKNAYEVASNAAAFPLDAKARYGDDIQLSYTSGNPAVAEVAADGTVTPKGVGSTTITVKAAKKNFYTEGTYQITVTVYDPCQKNGHSFGDWTEALKPTCTADGSKERTCTVCQVKEIEKVTAAGHKFGGWTQVQAPTCTETGSKERACAVCSAKETESVAANGHSFSAWTQIQAPTCTESGSQERACTVCSAKETESVAANGHSHGNWTVTKAPTCTAGEETGVCSVCGDVTTRSMDPVTTEHTYGDPVHTDATCSQAGYNTYTCIHCGNIKTEETDPATGNHAFTSDIEFCGNGCGASNPDYVPPAPPPADEEPPSE